MDDYDYDRLRRDLIDHFGTLAQIYPAAYLSLARVERASNYELLKIAAEEGYDLSDYENQSLGLF